MLYGIQTNQIDSIWSLVAPMLQRAIDKSQHDYAVQDLYNLIHNRDMQLWIWDEDGKIIACCLTSIVNFPRRRVLAIPFIAGQQMKIWLHAEETLRVFAKANGCTQTEGYARKGWLRVLKNWRAVWTTIRSDL